jgi:hypothetical protein
MDSLPIQRIIISAFQGLLLLLSVDLHRLAAVFWTALESSSHFGRAAANKPVRVKAGSEKIFWLKSAGDCWI